MSEKEQLWNALYEAKWSECYATQYRARAVRIDRWITCFTTVLSLSSVSTWWFWSYLPWLWSSLIIASQLTMALKPHIPSLKYLSALKYYIPEMRTLATDAQTKWFAANGTTAKVSKSDVKSLLNRHKDLGNKFFGDDELPTIKSVDTKARQDWELYLSKLTPEKGDAPNVRETSSPSATAS